MAPTRIELSPAPGLEMASGGRRPRRILAGEGMVVPVRPVNLKVDGAWETIEPPGGGRRTMLCRDHEASGSAPSTSAPPGGTIARRPTICESSSDAPSARSYGRSSSSAAAPACARAVNGGCRALTESVGGCRDFLLGLVAGGSWQGVPPVAPGGSLRIYGRSCAHSAPAEVATHGETPLPSADRSLSLAWPSRRGRGVNPSPREPTCLETLSARRRLDRTRGAGRLREREGRS
jgi:hypothetical protein